MAINRLRHKLVIVFLAATLVPLAAALWASSALMSRSLAFVATDDVSGLATSLDRVGREYYRQVRQRLALDAASGRVLPHRLNLSTRSTWPAPLQQFWDSGESDRFLLSDPDGEQLQYALRRGDEVWLYSTDLDGVRMGDLSRQISAARARTSDLRRRDLPRGFTLALAIASAVVWIVSLAVALLVSTRITRPIQHLTAGLGEVAAGRFDVRLAPSGRDEIGQAIDAFNQTAVQLQESRERLVYLTQVASWQMLARKMAHELKNSLTPIRLTVDDIAARHATAEPEFFERAAAIVVDEVTRLEGRVRAFSDFAAEPDPRPAILDIAAIVGERVEFLRAAHPDLTYQVDASSREVRAWADEDHVKGILTNLLENAADAAGENGTILVTIGTGRDASTIVEVHDSGPGVTAGARVRLFEPAISFKKHGMGLGLAISRKHALVAGGDLALVEGRLSGAGFRLTLPALMHGE